MPGRQPKEDPKLAPPKVINKVPALVPAALLTVIAQELATAGVIDTVKPVRSTVYPEPVSVAKVNPVKAGAKPGMRYVPAAGVITGAENEIAAVTPSRHPLTVDGVVVGVGAAGMAPEEGVNPPKDTTKHPRAWAPV